METLKFLMVSSHFPPHHLGGDAVFVKYLSEELVRRGHQVDVYYTPTAYKLMRGNMPVKASGKQPERLNVHQFYYRLGTTGLLFSLSLGVSSKAREGLKDLAKEVKPDVIHWHNTRGFLGKPFSIPNSTSVYTAHDYYAVCPRANLLRPGSEICRKPFLCQTCLLRWGKPPQFWRMNGRRVIKPPREALVLSPSDFMAKRLEEDGIKVHRTIRNFVPDMADSGAREGLAPADRDQVLYLGMLEVHKGPQTLLEAFSRSRERQGFKLVMIGEGSLKNRLRERARKLEMLDRVRIPGFLSREEVNSELRKAAVQVIPSEWHENAPLTALEALSLSIPLIGSNLGGLPEILGPETGSSMFDAGNVDDLSNKLVAVWERRSNLKELRKMARRQYEERFRADRHISEYISTIKGANT